MVQGNCGNPIYYSAIASLASELSVCCPRALWIDFTVHFAQPYLASSCNILPDTLCQKSVGFLHSASAQQSYLFLRLSDALIPGVTYVGSREVTVMVLSG